MKNENLVVKLRNSHLGAGFNKRGFHSQQFTQVPFLFVKTGGSTRCGVREASLSAFFLRAKSSSVMT